MAKTIVSAKPSTISVIVTIACDQSIAASVTTRLKTAPGPGSR